MAQSYVTNPPIRNPAARGGVLPEQIEVVQGNVGAAGPPGPPGLDANTDLVLTAGTNLSGQRCVTMENGVAVYVDLATIGVRAIGVTTGAASQGQPVTARDAGPMTEPTWNWTVGLPLYAGPNGLITQTPPAAPAMLRIIGVATSPTDANLYPYPAIQQA